MKVDVACVGDPFLDLIFRGLPAIPVPGEEQLATSLVIVPGGIANVAYALRRLGLDAVVCAPIGRDPAGRLLAELMAEAGIPWLGRDAAATPVSVALPADDDRAFVTVSPAPSVDLETLAGIEARAILVDLPSVERLPAHPRIHAVVGDPEVALMAGRLPASLAGIRTLILNEREVRGLTGIADPREAAGRLARLGTTVVVTRGPAGVLAVEPGGQTIEAAAPVSRVDDATGAGDLFAGAYIWADLDGQPLAERLRRAVTYASGSLGRPAERQKGMTLEELSEHLRT
jgi:sugar/nucleoside kinase (ribokinase family)